MDIMDKLINLQKTISKKVGFKVDVYHSEEHKGILAVRHGEPLTPFNIIYQQRY